MARNFNDATDRIDYTAIWNPSGVPFSFSCWTYRTQGAENGYFWYRGATSATVGIAVWHRGADIGAGSVELYRPGSANSCRRWSNVGELPANAWHNLIATHDGTFLDGTTIHIYVDGTEVGYAGTGDGSETEATYAAALWSIGGRTYDNARNYGGYLAEMATWNRVIAGGEISALAAGYSPLFFMEDIKGHWPLVRDTLDRINSDYGTLDGTTVIAHPPKILYPASAMMFLTPAAGPTLSINVTPSNFDYWKQGVRVVG